MRERFLVLAFWAAAAFAFVMAVLPHPPQGPIEPSDKVKHIIAFLTLASLAAAAYPRSSLLRIWLFLALFGAVIEAVQAIPALGRDSEIADWGADCVAAMIPLVLVMVIRRRRATIARPG